MWKAVIDQNHRISVGTYLRHNNPAYVTLPDGLKMGDVDENALLGILNGLRQKTGSNGAE
jgi:hypothetical protein